METIAAGDYSKSVPFTGPPDETGALARSIDVLKGGASRRWRTSAGSRQEWRSWPARCRRPIRSQARREARLGARAAPRGQGGGPT
ncbi:MAG: hypothetical protein IPP07_23245 [Holophagales bacterium]|nr:hypothetical protein [Holophagales bacterium]